MPTDKTGKTTIKTGNAGFTKDKVYLANTTQEFDSYKVPAIKKYLVVDDSGKDISLVEKETAGIFIVPGEP
jgi:hypothetical protein